MEIIFERAGEPVVVKVEGKNVYFSNQQVGFEKGYPIESLKLNTDGIVKEFPDLKDKPDGEKRKLAVERFKEKIKSLKTRNEIKNYLIVEFEGMGYTLKCLQIPGFRPRKGDKAKGAKV